MDVSISNLLKALSNNPVPINLDGISDAEMGAAVRAGIAELRRRGWRINVSTRFALDEKAPGGTLHIDISRVETI